ncbi:uncharacterized protein (TIGR00299 family) protein [Halanaerobium sp. MA284_MarDTE_T2]|nr:uncharacterized protein (TIGR00299 family) protein [Halanaerobium sp. MA284_MarDTE_T2]RCW86827.1 uncharacterized protein (TIGR00299 family) protein [Halanaerobium sp. DL-01]
MEKILYFECSSGISGDMTIAALLDLGLDQEEFLNKLKKLNLSGYKIEIKKTQKNGITGTDFKVLLNNTAHPDHIYEDSRDHEHSHHDHEHYHDHNHNDDQHSHNYDKKNHNHVHKEDKGHHHPGSGEHHHRNLGDIEKLIDESELNENIKELSKKIFSYVAEAEAKVHSKPLNEVHFHEVGAVDSIVDIVGTAILIDMLDADYIYSSAVPIGSGFVNVAHGNIPVPAPATIEILKDVPVYASGIKSELVTPTGAAIIKTLAEEFCPLPEVKIKKIAYGAGKKDLEITNMLRLYLAEKSKKKVKNC